jgi:branched-chain amino acid transport system substrate-binding protein
MMTKSIYLIITLVSILVVSSPAVQTQDELVCEIDVIVQRDDWLSRLSEKFYGDILAFPAIAEATNAKAAVDNSYTVIEDVDFIEIGWKLCIVDIQVAEGILGFELRDAPLSSDIPTNLTGEIRIGAVHDLSGPFARTGRSIRNGIDLAVNEINGGVLLGGAVLRVVWEDTAGDKGRAVNAFGKLVNEDQVVAILGPTLSRSAFAAIPIAQQAGVPVIGSSNAAAGLIDLGDYVFHTNLPESAIIANTVQRANELLDLQSVVILYDNSTAFTKFSRAAFEQALSSEDIEIVSSISFNRGALDFSAQLREIQAVQPDAIVLSALAEDASNIILQARQLGISEEVRFIGGSSLDSSAILAMEDDIINGTISGAAWNANDISGSNRKFVADYQAEYGEQPDLFAAQAYTAVWALATALRLGDTTDRAAVRDALAELNPIVSPLGLFTFNDNRTPEHLPVSQVIENGELVILK